MNELLEKVKTVELLVNPKPLSLLELMYQNIKSKELIQSEMLATLLNPDQNHGHGNKLIVDFLARIEVHFEYGVDSNLKVEVERVLTNKRRIDILISWVVGGRKHAVIVENKLNNAPDQENQLADYYTLMIKEGYVIDKIVYMPLSKKWKSSQKTDTPTEILASTIDFDAQDIVDWLKSYLNVKDEKNSFCQRGLVWEYYEFMNCLISNQYIMDQVVEIQKNLSFEEMDKLEKISELMRTQEWCKLRFQPLVKGIDHYSFDQDLIISYKQSKTFVNYIQLYFENWRDSFWYEVWLYPSDGFYVYKYDGRAYVKDRKFEVTEVDSLIEYTISCLEKLPFN